MQTQSSITGTRAAGPSHARDVIIHYSESVRHSQLARFEAGLEPQTCDDVARELLLEIKEQQKKFEPGTRVDVPTWRVISRVLGVICTGAKITKDPMVVFELSAEEIARIAGYGRSQVEAALRWLRPGPIWHKGKIVAHGLGVIDRTARKCFKTIKGRLRGAYRTSLTALSKIGRDLTGVIAIKASGRKVFDKEIYKRERRRQLDKARRDALRKIKETLHRFWNRNRPAEASLDEPIATDDEIRESEITNPFEIAYRAMARRALAMEGKTLGFPDI